jgi:hypothetical protein
MALLDADIGPVKGGVNRVPIEPTSTIRPPAWRSSGRSAWVTASCPVTLTSSWWRNCSMGTISSGPKAPMPALFTSPSRPAWAAWAATVSAAAPIWAGSVTSSSRGVISPEPPAGGAGASVSRRTPA